MTNANTAERFFNASCFGKDMESGKNGHILLI